MFAGGLIVAIVAIFIAALAAGDDGPPGDSPPANEGAERAWTAEVQSTLKNAATAAESFAVANNGRYSGITIEALAEQGLAPTPNVMVVDIQATSIHYCIIVTHLRLPSEHEWHIATYDSDVGTPDVSDTC